MSKARIFPPGAVIEHRKNDQGRCVETLLSLEVEKMNIRLVEGGAL